MGWAWAGLGLAFREFSYGVQGVNTRGDGVYGVSHILFGSGVHGMNDDQGGAGVLGEAHAQGGTGGWFIGAEYGAHGTGVRDTGVFADGGSIGLLAGGNTGVSATGNSKGIYGATQSAASGAFAIHGEVANAQAAPGSAAVRGEHDGVTAGGAGVWGSHAGSGLGGFFARSAGSTGNGRTRSGHVPFRHRACSAGTGLWTGCGNPG